MPPLSTPHRRASQRNIRLAQAAQRERGAASRAAFDAFVARQTAGGYHIRVVDAAAALPAWEYGTTYNAIARERREGRLVKMHGDLDGCAVPGAHGVAPNVTLADLLARARARTSPNAEAKAGRKAAHAALNLTSITPSQLEWIERLADLVVRRFDAVLRLPRREGADAIPGVYCVWTAMGLEGRPGWALHTPVTQWALADHHAAHERRRREAERRKTEGLSCNEDHLVPWSRDLATETVSKYRAAVNNLLNLAATPISEAFPPLIDPSPRITERAQDCDYDPILVPSIAYYERVVRRSFAADGRPAYPAGVQAVKHFATYLTRVAAAKYRGGLPPADAYRLTGADWRAARELMIEDRHRGLMPDDVFGNARRAWQRVHGRVVRLQAAVHRMMAKHHPKAERNSIAPEYAWPTRAEPRRALVSEQAIRRAANAALIRPHARDFSLWCAEDGSSLSTLVNAGLGVRHFVSWAMTPAYARAEYGVPERQWALRPVGRYVGKHPVPGILASGTVAARLKLIAILAGWASKAEGIDWTMSGLDALCDIGLLRRWVLAMRQEKGTDTRTTLIAQTVETMGVLANGFLFCEATHRVARIDALLAASDDCRPATRARLERLRPHYAHLAAKCGTFYEAVVAYARLNVQRPPSRKVSEVRAKVLKINRGYRGSDGEHGYRKMRRFVDAIERDVIAAGGGMSLRAQIAAARAGTLRWTPTHARLVQMGVAVTLALRVPLRSDEVVDSRREMYVNEPVADQVAWNRPLALHEGALRAEFPAQLVKSGRRFAPSYMLPKHVRTSTQTGSAAMEQGLRRDLLELYDCPGGARDYALMDVDLETGDPRRDEVGNIVYRSAWIAPADRPDAPQVYHARLPWMYPFIPAKSTGQRRRVNVTEDGRWIPSAFSQTFKDLVVRFATPDDTGVRVLPIHLETLLEIEGALSWHTLRRLYGSYVVNVLEKPRRAQVMLQHASMKTTTDIYAEQDETQEVTESLEQSEAEEQRVQAAALDAQHRTDEVWERRLAAERTERERERQQFVAQLVELTTRLANRPTMSAQPDMTPAAPSPASPELLAALQGVDVPALLNAVKALGLSATR